MKLWPETNKYVHSFIHLFHIPLILYRCGTSHVYIYVFPAWEEKDVSHPYKVHG